MSHERLAYMANQISRFCESQKPETAIAGIETPRAFRARSSARFFAISAPVGGLIVVLLVTSGDQVGVLAFTIRPDPFGRKRNFSMGW